MKCNFIWNFDSLLKWLKSPFFIAAWFLLIGVSYFYFDRAMAIYMHQSLGQKIYRIADTITVLGLGAPYVITFAILFLLGRFIFKNYSFAYKSLYLCVSVVISGVLCDIFKFFFGRARPELFLTKHIYGFYFFKTHYSMISFPSGHATVITCLFIALSFLRPRLWYVFLILAILVSASRIFLGVHYLSDVLAGMFLGGMAAILSYNLFSYYHLLDEF